MFWNRSNKVITKETEVNQRGTFHVIDDRGAAQKWFIVERLFVGNNTCKRLKGEE